MNASARVPFPSTHEPAHANPFAISAAHTTRVYVYATFMIRLHVARSAGDFVQYLYAPATTHNKKCHAKKDASLGFVVDAVDPQWYFTFNYDKELWVDLKLLYACACG